MSRTIQITNPKNSKSPWIWVWDDDGRMIVPQDGDIVTADGSSLIGHPVSQTAQAQPQTDWKKFTVNVGNGHIAVADYQGVITEFSAAAESIQRIPLFALTAGGYLEQAVIATGSRFVCSSAASITCGMGMNQQDDFFVACKHELTLENANKPTQNTGSGTNDLRGGLVFLTLDVLGSVIANIESGTVNVWIRTSQLPL